MRAVVLSWDVAALHIVWFNKQKKYHTRCECGILQRI